MIRRFLLAALAAAAAPFAARAGDGATLSIDQQVAAATSSQSVTVVHFWAPWCPNCKAELSNGGWSGFIAANPGVNFVFVTIWNPADGHEVLAANGVGGGGELPAAAPSQRLARRGTKVDQVLGIPISWIPTTWVFKDGKLRYAMNYGELRFPMLQQLIKDSSDSWEH
jgi:thiol-disulfide isomerase/thioredoxin